MLDKIYEYEISRKSASGSRIVYEDGQTDRNDEGNIRFSQLCERA
jgi:hypothetical protein